MEMQESSSSLVGNANEMSKLSEEAKKNLLRRLSPDDEVIIAETPSFWRSNIGILVIMIIGTIFFLVMLFGASK